MTIGVHAVINQDQIARQLILGAEGHNLRVPTNVGDDTITVGYGYVFIFRLSPNSFAVRDSAELTADLAAIGITLSQNQWQQINQITVDLNQGNKPECLPWMADSIK